MLIIARNIVFKFLSVLASVLMMFGTVVDWFIPDDSQWNTSYEYVFVHGLMGWGSYDYVNDIVPYWGMFSGDLMEYLNTNGHSTYSASVSGEGSAWDRACELYAQLTGTRTDYGEAHSEKYGHDRYGTDYTGRKLIKKQWSEENKINLLGHSFGGPTIRLLAHLMEYGDEAEKTASDDVSGLFTGGKGDWIYSITTLASPNNGTTAFFFTRDNNNQQQEYYLKKIAAKLDSYDYGKILIKLFMLNYTKEQTLQPDNAYYDMQIDNVIDFNKQIKTVDSIYYFAVPCVAGTKDEKGIYTPRYDIMEPLFWTCSEFMGKTTVTTDGGFLCDESWYANDGLVNTVSAGAPAGSESVQYEEGKAVKGIWNVMPVYEGDHMSLQGDMLQVNEVKDYYMYLLNSINEL